MNDPAQELAQRVAEKWFANALESGKYVQEFQDSCRNLATLIATELRVEGWVDKASHEKALAEQWEDAADFTTGRMHLDEIREDPTKVIKWADLEAGTASVAPMSRSSHDPRPIAAIVARAIALPEVAKIECCDTKEGIDLAMSVPHKDVVAEDVSAQQPDIDVKKALARRVARRVVQAYPKRT